MFELELVKLIILSGLLVVKFGSFPLSIWDAFMCGITEEIFMGFGGGTN